MSRLLLEGLIEGRLGSEAGVHGQSEDVQVFRSGLCEPAADVLDSVGVDEVVERLPKLGVQDFGQLMRRRVQLLSQVRQCQIRIAIWMIPGHEREERCFLGAGIDIPQS